MLKDITLGQYFPGNTVIHKLDPRSKLLWTVFYVVIIFCIKNIFGYALLVALLGLIIGVSGVPFRTVIKSIKPLLFIILLTALLNMFYTSGNVIWSWKFLTLTDRGIVMAVFMVLRLIILIIGTSMLTYTTSPILLTDAIERLLKPLKKVKFPVHELAMMMSIALRFIPTLIEETDKIISAQKARGGDFESGGLIKRAKALIPVLVPLFVSAFRRADDLAIAMECRCYHGDEGRTALKQLKYTPRDLLVLGFGVVLLLGIAWINSLQFGWHI